MGPTFWATCRGGADPPAAGGWGPGGGDLGEFTFGKRWGVFMASSTRFAHGPLLSLQGSVAGSSRRVRAQTGHRASGGAQNQLQRRIGRPKETAPGSVLGATETVKQDESNLERLRCMDGEGAVKEVLRAKREIDEQCQRRVFCAVTVGCGETKKMTTAQVLEYVAGQASRARRHSQR